MLLAHVDTLLLGAVFQQSNLTLQTMIMNKNALQNRLPKTI